MEDLKMLQRFFNNNDFDFFNNDVFFPSLFKNNTMDSIPPVTVSETENGYDIEVAAPGYDKGDFKVDVDKNVLTISAEKKQEEESGDKKSGKNYRKEFSFTQFQRSFTLPDDVDTEKITGNYTNGILKLEIPHGAQAPKKSIEIK